jgi:purine-nucleoside phosphorylase
MQEELSHIEESCAYIQQHTRLQPRIGIVLGSGLGAFAEQATQAVHLPYNTLPHFSGSTIAGHAGTLVLGNIGDVPCCIMSGRIHFYEGHTPNKVVFPIRVMKKLGITQLLVTNAAGGINPHFAPGTLMNITDHINLTGQSPLIGHNPSSWGPRFPDMTYAYSPRGQNLLHNAAQSLNIPLQNGVYAGLTGPSYETPAEIRMLRTLGADAVGMSTVLEVLASVHMGIETVGLSVISNAAAGITEQPLSHQEVTQAANQAKPALISLLNHFIPRWKTQP